MDNLTWRFCHRNCPLWMNGPKWLVLKSLNWLESRLLRGRERSSLLVHALSHFCLLTLLPTLLFFSIAFYFVLCFCASLFFRCSWFFFFFFYYAQLKSFYTACRDKIYHFTPQLLLACYGCPSLATYWSASYLATTTTLCWLCHAPFLDKGNFVLSSCFP